MRARIAPAAVLAFVALGIAAPAASGAQGFLAPASADFGSLTVGSTTAPQPFTLSVDCGFEDPLNNGLCAAPQIVDSAVSTTGDFGQTNNCPSTLIVNSYPGSASCTINVTFTPTAAGPRAGTLYAGGDSSPLSGTGIALPAATPSQQVDVTAAIRKCKKKFPKGPKRKRCIKRAKSLAY